MKFLTQAGLVLLSIGGLSGMLLYVALDKPKGWLAIKQTSRLRQGHVDALIIGTILLALGALAPLPMSISWVLVISGFYTSLATGALAWWPDWATKSRLGWWIDFGSLSSFALAMTAAMISSFATA
ncbi:hypothetical protein A6U87_07225 [Rhizobium sp. AC44/96]|uniref:hypothetical protein n=1 Tax=Rhizobium sp. AC44/96 TaxID=1841654 RepID=UPI00080F8C17|nr:hypothetical protein [Rhizobium sp. AC44/96]OCJ13076.1 hypothetical protein A6U87_07225 [Rhizobium sp. AC44/96]